ncbi:MAG: DUF3105 domain-containing protein [Meiothermus sp.]|uniref:DUF3105 domain-containing protein n=1 Tax=Meiothermus sp. TaxID=1955249 RepID=UPI0025E54AAD|nr:DUF3105 domain-containing protein [Meiothermus sp.]MCS7067232.1 DUF3105 domain-containing protein [Meiothermus sp.]
MANQAKKKKKSASGYRSQPKPSPMPWVWGAGGVLAVLLGGFFWWQGRSAGEFDALIAQGQPELEAQVISHADAGRGHINLGTPVQYATDPPTSGVHWPNWTNPGFYERPEPKEKLVHALEHGNVVIYYDTPSAEALNQIRSWQRRFTGQWDGLVVVPKPGLGQTIELTAWNKLLRLDTWNAALAAAFVDAYRGRGPENPVR